MPKKVNTRAKAKTTARAKAVARPATLVAKAKETARPMEANHLKHSDETAVVRNGPESSTPAFVFRHGTADVDFLEGFDRYGVLIL
jgi:hypothetical protein